MPFRRTKRERDQRRPDIDGPLSHGVTVTDPAGRSQVEPFTGDAGDVLLGDGTFGQLPGTSVEWGDITGVLSDQTDLQNALNAKQDLLVFDDDLKAYVVDAS